MPAQHLLVEVRKGVSTLVIRGGRLDAALLDKHQFAAHGYAWLATYVAGLQQMLAWAERLEERGQAQRAREPDAADRRTANIWRRSPAASPMTQVEMVRPRDMGVSDEALHAFWHAGGGQADQERQHRRGAHAHRRS